MNPVSELSSLLAQGRLALFIGADMPRTVTGLPSRADLAQVLAGRKSGLPSGRSLAETAELFVAPHGFRNELIRTLRQHLDTTGREVPRFHRLVVGLGVGTIITTAYDNLLELAFDAVGQPVNRLVQPADIGINNDPNLPTLIRLYGDLLRGDLNQLVITKSDHIGLTFRPDKVPLFNLVRTVFQTRAVLFLGYDLSDPDFELLYAQVLDQMKPFNIGAYAVWPGMAEAYRQMWAGQGITVINADPLAVLEELSAAGRIGPVREDLRWLLTEPPARDIVPPPVSPHLQVLPFNDLSWENFELLCARLVAREADIVDSHRYGKEGEAQHGIDILAERRSGERVERWAYQCKRYTRYTVSDLHKALDKFAFDADFFVIMLSCRAGKALRDIMAEQPGKYLWDAEDLSRKLKDHPDLVEDFFGKVWRDSFCGNARG